MMVMRFEFDQDIDRSYGVWTCDDCGTKFYGGGRALHNEDCPATDQGYDSCVYHFGPVEAKAIINSRTGRGPVSPRDLTKEIVLELTEGNLD